MDWQQTDLTDISKKWHRCNLKGTGQDSALRSYNQIWPFLVSTINYGVLVNDQEIVM